MIKLINQKFQHETGITFKVYTAEFNKSKRIKLLTSHNDREFIFDKSSLETFSKVVKAFQEIQKFIEKL